MSVPFSPSYVFTANKGSNDVSTFSADKDGILTFVGRTPAGQQPSAILTDGTDVYVANSGDNTISCFQIGTGGVLIPSSTIQTGFSPSSFSGFNDNGYQQTLIVACSGSNEYIEYNVKAGPTLELVGRVGVGNTPKGLVHGLSGDYVTNFGDGTVSSINPQGPFLEAPSTHTVGQGPSQIYETAFAQNQSNPPADQKNGDRKLYVLNQTDGSFSVIRESTANGAVGVLEPLGTVKTGVNPIALACTVPMRGDHWPANGVYTLNRGTETISTYLTTSSSPVIPVKVSGGEPSSGSLPTAMIMSEKAGNLVDLAYVVGENGNIRRYIVPVNGTPMFQEEVSTQGIDPVAIAQTPFGFVPTTLAITNTLPDGSLGVKYSAALTSNRVYGNTPFHLSAGTLPPGLSITSSPDTLSGTPTTAGTYTFTLEVDSINNAATKQFTVHVQAPFSISTTTLPGATVAVGYSSDLMIAGGDGTQSATWSVSSGALPPGLSLKTNPTSEVLSGTPTTAGSYTFTLTATQGTLTASQAYTIVVGAGTSGGTTVRFLDAATDANDISVLFNLSTLSFPSTGFGNISAPQTTSLTNSVPYTASNQAGDVWNPGSTFVSSGSRSTFVALGPTAADRKIGFLFFSPTFPGTIDGGIAFMNGIPARDASAVDVYLLNSSGVELTHQFNLSYGSFTSFSATPGSYTLKVTLAGSPSTVLATSAAQTVSAGQNFIKVAVQPEGASPTFVQVQEN